MKESIIEVSKYLFLGLSIFIVAYLLVEIAIALGFEIRINITYETFSN